MRSWLIFLVLLATGAWAQVYPGYPGTVPPAYPGYPGTVPPAYPGYPGAVPPTYPGYPGSVPPAYPGYPGAVPSTYPGYPGSLPQTTPGYPGTMPAAAPQDLWLYGGKGHQVLLGSLTASKLAPESVWNSYGRYGSSFNDDSIWNQFGTYGSEFSAVSPWNQFGTDPPVVVDKAGHVMGDFTVNQLDAHRTQVPSLLYILNNFRDFRTNLDTYRASMP